MVFSSEIMDTTDKVSIIICLYNVSSFLERKKLSCILEQSYSNLEIILVNDGSTDDTVAICRKIASIDSRIVVVSKVNGGLGSARNAGLDVATGDFVWFYDVDDEADLDLVEKNVSWMHQYDVDLNIFSYWCITPSRNLTEEVHFKDHYIQDNKTLKSIFVNDLLLVPNGNGFAWNKFYSRSFIEEHHFRFGNQRIQQDELFNLQFYPIIERVYVSSEMLYHYYIYNSGNNRSRFIPDRYEIYVSIFKGMKKIERTWGLVDAKFTDYIYNRFYCGIENVILFNTFHPNAHYSDEKKKTLVLDILGRPETYECMNYIRTKMTELSVEQRLYYFAYQKQSFLLICCFKKISYYLRMFKKIIVA